MDFKHILRIVNEIDPTGAIRRRILDIAEALAAPDVIMMEIMGYRGIEVADLGLINVRLDQKLQFVEYVIQHDISALIAHLFRQCDYRWPNIVAEHKYAITTETAAVIARRDRLLLNMIDTYLERRDAPDALMMSNMYTLTLAILPGARLHTRSDIARGRLDALADWARESHMAVPAAVQIYLDAYTAVTDDDSGDDNRGAFDSDDWYYGP